jgi:ribonuclease-3
MSSAELPPTETPGPASRNRRGRRRPAGHPDLTAVLDRFQTAIGYCFRQPQLLQEALIHASQGARRGGQPFSNEKLEFLGDRVLGLLIADTLFRRYPDEAVGQFAARFAGLVDRETLAGIARTLNLEAFLQFAGDEGERTDKRMTSPLADGCEAVIGALYLDGGLAAAGEFVNRYWQPLLDQMHTPARDAKSRLQEWAQARGLPRPVYRETGRVGPAHLPMFTIEAVLAGWPPAVGEGDSKRHAEQAAAAHLLADLERHPPRAAAGSASDDSPQRKQT